MSLSEIHQDVKPLSLYTFVFMVFSLTYYFRKLKAYFLTWVSYLVFFKKSTFLNYFYYFFKVLFYQFYLHVGILY